MAADVDAVRDRLRSALRAAYEASDEERARHPHTMGLSALGGCTRQNAYRLARVEPSEPSQREEGRAANHGTWIHAGMLPWLAKFLDAAYEVPVVLHAAGLEIPGHIDLDGDEFMLDVKTVGERKLHGVRRAGAYANHRLQVLGYAVARHQAGRPLRWVAWLYVDRATGDDEVVIEEFTPAAAMEVIDRVRTLRRWAEHPDDAPREGPGPGDKARSFVCNECPWLRRCWGPDAVRGQSGVQRVLQQDLGVERLLELLDHASAERARSTADYEYAREALRGARAGQYGQWSLRWAAGGGEVVDQAAAVALLKQHGLPVPTRPTTRRALVRLTSALSRPQQKQLASQVSDEETDEE